MNWGYCMNGSKGKEVISPGRVVFILLVDFNYWWGCGEGEGVCVYVCWGGGWLGGGGGGGRRGGCGQSSTCVLHADIQYFKDKNYEVNGRQIGGGRGDGGGGGRGGCTQFVHGRGRLAIDLRIPTMPGRSTSGFRQPGSHCLHQARSVVRYSASRMKGEPHPSKNRL